MAEIRSRRHGAELERAILAATWAELSDVGYTALTIEAVAKRAQTSKPVIYRRWPSRAHLVMAAWASRRPTEPGAPDTGSLRDDLLVVFTRIAKIAGTMMGETIAGVMAEAFKHPEVVALLRERLDSAPHNRIVQTVIDNAVGRGEISAVAVPHRVLRLPLDLIRAECMACGGPVGGEMVVELVDEVFLPLLRGLASPGSSR